MRTLAPVPSLSAAPPTPTPVTPPTAPLLGAPAQGRLALVDVARGLAILQMIAYHLCFDLNHFSWIHINMLRDPAWIAWRTGIVAQFLFLVGVSLALRASSSAVGNRPNWRRWAQVAACAALVSVASWTFFGARWIWFGVLHFVAVAQLLLPRIARFGTINLFVGILLIGIGYGVHLDLFASNALSWIGFSPIKPGTEDFVPLLPWTGVVLLGIGCAVGWQQGQGRVAHFLRCAPGRLWRLPGFLGRWPLTTYMVHQPILFGALSLLGTHH